VNNGRSHRMPLIPILISGLSELSKEFSIVVGLKNALVVVLIWLSFSLLLKHLRDVSLTRF